MKNLLLLTAALTGAAALLLVNRRPLSAAVAGFLNLSPFMFPVE